MAFKVPKGDELVEHVISTVLDRVKMRTPVRTGKARAGWQRTDRTITNEVNYIGFLEYGTPKERPVGMVRTTLEEVPSIVRDYLNNRK